MDAKMANKFSRQNAAFGMFCVVVSHLPSARTLRSREKEMSALWLLTCPVVPVSGAETTAKLIKLRVLVVGLRGVGVETVKNLSLQVLGPPAIVRT